MNKMKSLIYIIQTKREDALNFLKREIEKLLNNKINNITTTGNIAASLNYNLKDYKNNSEMIEFLNKKLIIDDKLFWTENKILLKYNSEIIHEIEVYDPTNTLL